MSRSPTVSYLAFRMTWRCRFDDLKFLPKFQSGAQNTPMLTRHTNANATRARLCTQRGDQIEMWGVSSVARSGDVTRKPARQQFWNLWRCHHARLRRRAGMGEGSYITLFSPSEVTAFHRIMYGKGVLYSLVFTEWRHCASHNDQNNSVFDKPTRSRSCELSIGYTNKPYLIHHKKRARVIFGKTDFILT